MCYYHLHPDAPQRRTYLTKQKHLHQTLTQQLPDRPFRYDTIVDGGCSKRRPDFLFDCGTHTVMVENDEDRHVGVQCEDKRTMELFRDLGNRPLVQIRFNPDMYRTVAGARQPGCFHQTGPQDTLAVDTDEWARCWGVLKQVLVAALDTVPQRELTITYLFYDD